MTISMNPKDKELLQATFKPVELVTNILTFIKMDTDLGVHIMRSIRCALHGFVSLEAKGNMILSTSADDSFNMLVDMLTESIWSKKRRMK
jgi:hypothetical protein